MHVIQFVTTVVVYGCNVEMRRVNFKFYRIGSKKKSAILNVFEHKVDFLYEHRFQR